MTVMIMILHTSLRNPLGRIKTRGIVFNSGVIHTMEENRLFPLIVLKAIVSAPSVLTSLSSQAEPCSQLLTADDNTLLPKSPPIKSHAGLHFRPAGAVKFFLTLIYFADTLCKIRSNTKSFAHLCRRMLFWPK